MTVEKKSLHAQVEALLQHSPGMSTSMIYDLVRLNFPEHSPIWLKHMIGKYRSAFKVKAGKGTLPTP